MEKIEIAELVEYLSLFDGRQVTAEKIQAWNDVVGFLDFATAKAAVIEAQRDVNIRYVEPKHIVAIALAIREKAKAEKQQAELKEGEVPWVGVPHPICAHGKRLLTCDPCCKNAAIQAGLIKG
jgi:hypothetical protein